MDNKLFECNLKFVTYANSEFEAASLVESIQEGFYITGASTYDVKELEVKKPRKSKKTDS